MQQQETIALGKAVAIRVSVNYNATPHRSRQVDVLLFGKVIALIHPKPIARNTLCSFSVHIRVKEHAPPVSKTPHLFRVLCDLEPPCAVRAFV